MSKLTKKDYRRLVFDELYFMRAIALNYETMHSAGFSHGFIDALNKIYDGDKEVVGQKLDQYLKYYNTNPMMHPFIAGACVAIEETKKPQATETAVALRTGLMGPFAGLGDSLFFMNGRVILGSLAGYMWLNGSPIGMIICFAFGVLLYLMRTKLFWLGHNQGVSVITNNQDRLKVVTNACIVLGMIVIGAMIPSTVKFALKPTFTYGDASVTLSDFMDSIVPYLIPTLITLGIYKGLGVKGMTTVKMVWIVIAAAIVLTAIGLI